VAARVRREGGNDGRQEREGHQMEGRGRKPGRGRRGQEMEEERRREERWGTALCSEGAKAIQRENFAASEFCKNDIIFNKHINIL
jgi:hypothetical protein